MKKKFIEVLKSHTGALLVTGGLCLKAGALLNSFTVAAPGYFILVAILAHRTKNWRDGK